MLERGHAHHLVPVTTFVQPNGIRVVHSRCQAAPATPDAPAPSCPLEEERAFDLAGQPVSIRFRMNGIWFQPLDLLRILPIGVDECPACGGDRMLVPCDNCNGVGVVQDGGLLAMPDLHVKL